MSNSAVTVASQSVVSNIRNFYRRAVSGCWLLCKKKLVESSMTIGLQKISRKIYPSYVSSTLFSNVSQTANWFHATNLMMTSPFVNLRLFFFFWTYEYLNRICFITSTWTLGCWHNNHLVHCLFAGICGERVFAASQLLIGILWCLLRSFLPPWWNVCLCFASMLMWRRIKRKESCSIR